MTGAERYSDHYRALGLKSGNLAVPPDSAAEVTGHPDLSGHWFPNGSNEGRIVDKMFFMILMS